MSYRSGEVPVEHATISNLLSSLLKKILFHPTTIKASLLAGILALALYAKLNRVKTIQGKTVVVTGAGNGLGRAIAMELAKRKCKVIIWDIDQDGLNKTAELVKEKYPQA